jgi:hypothetical protein
MAGEGHSSGKPAPVDGGDAHRAKVAPAHRRKRPVCTVLDGVEEVGAPAARSESRRPRKLEQELLETLIVRAWTKTLKGPYDWGDWPLARYTLGPEFLGEVERHTGRSASGVAWVCAMIACGRAPRLRSLDPQPLLGDGEDRQRVRSDGAAGWRCNLKRNAPEGPQLHYWIHPAGQIEFETVGAPREPCRE